MFQLHLGLFSLKMLYIAGSKQCQLEQVMETVPMFFLGLGNFKLLSFRRWSSLARSASPDFNWSIPTSILTSPTPSIKVLVEWIWDSSWQGIPGNPSGQKRLQHIQSHHFCTTFGQEVFLLVRPHPVELLEKLSFFGGLYDV
jgi:hypothetical protein